MSDNESHFSYEKLLKIESSIINSEEGMPRRKKRSTKERSLLERTVEALIGILIAYVSSYATDYWKIIFLLLGVLVILDALLRE